MAGSPRSGCPRGLLRTLFPVTGFPLCPHLVGGVRELSGASFVRALTPLRRAPFSCHRHLPEAAPPHATAPRSRFYSRELRRSFHHVRARRGDCHLLTRRQVLTRHRSAGASVLGFLVPRTLPNTSVSHEPPGRGASVIAVRLRQQSGLCRHLLSYIRTRRTRSVVGACGAVLPRT